MHNLHVNNAWLTHSSSILQMQVLYSRPICNVASCQLVALPSCTTALILKDHLNHELHKACNADQPPIQYWLHLSSAAAARHLDHFTQRRAATILNVYSAMPQVAGTEAQATHGTCITGVPCHHNLCTHTSTTIRCTYNSAVQHGSRQQLVIPTVSTILAAWLSSGQTTASRSNRCIPAQQPTHVYTACTQPTAPANSQLSHSTFKPTIAHHHGTSTVVTTQP
jgi:hypothetical protein